MWATLSLVTCNVRWHKLGDSGLGQSAAGQEEGGRESIVMCSCMQLWLDLHKEKTNPQFKPQHKHVFTYFNFYKHYTVQCVPVQRHTDQWRPPNIRLHQASVYKSYSPIISKWETQKLKIQSWYQPIMCVCEHSVCLCASATSRSLIHCRCNLIPPTLIYTPVRSLQFYSFIHRWFTRDGFKSIILSALLGHWIIEKWTDFPFPC